MWDRGGGQVGEAHTVCVDVPRKFVVGSARREGGVGGFWQTVAKYAVKLALYAADHPDKVVELVDALKPPTKIPTGPAPKLPR